jgi:hypothetical protein
VATFNPERRAHEQHSEVRPERTEERARALAALGALEARGAKLERLSGAALEAAFIPPTPRRPSAGQQHDQRSAAARSAQRPLGYELRGPLIYRGE